MQTAVQAVLEAFEARRVEKGISKSDLAVRSCCSRQVLYSSSLPRLETLFSLAEALDLDIGFYINERESA